jgi:hypothetical protein
VCGVINNRVCRVCLALRAARFARVALIAASAGPDALAPAAGLYASCLWCAPGSLAGSPDLAHRWSAPVVLRQLRLLRQHLPASAASPPLPSPLPDRPSPPSRSRSHGDSGVLCATPPPPPLRRERTRAVGTASAAFPRRVHPQWGGRGCRRLYPDHAGADGAAASSCARSSSANFRSSSARIRSSSAESFCSSDTIFSSPSQFSVPDILVLVRILSVIYLTPPLFLRVHFVPIRLPLLMRLLYGYASLRFFIFFVFLY